MVQRKLVAGILPLCVFLATDARAGFDEIKRLDKDPVRARIATHIVVGRLLGYAPAGPGDGGGDPPRKGLTRLVTEIEVSTVEKGVGIAAGSVVRVGFSSALDVGRLKFERGTIGGCADYWWFPLPGEMARLYLTLAPDGRFVADHPYDFFAIGDFVAPEVLEGKSSGYLSEYRSLLAKDRESAEHARRLTIGGAVVLIVATIPLVRHVRRRRAGAAVPMSCP